MIKRPILIVLGSYVIGILSYHFLNRSIFLFLFFFLISVCVYSIYKHLIKYNQDKIFYLIPILLLFGYIRMESWNQVYPLDEIVESQSVDSFVGEVNDVIEKTAGYQLVLKDCQAMVKQKTYAAGYVLVFCKEIGEIEIGNVVQVDGELMHFEKATNPGQFDEANYYKVQGYRFKCISDSVIQKTSNSSLFWRVTKKIKSKILNVYERVLNPEEYGLCAAMLLGESTFLDSEIKELYQKNGISHLIAISGLHITIIGMAIFRGIRKIGARLNIATIITIIFLIYYGVLTGFSVSTKRAVVMMIIFLMAEIVGRTYDIFSAMALSAFLILIQNPMQLYQVGFQLSYGAIIGIVLIYSNVLHALQVKNSILSGCLMSVCIQITTLPIVLYWFYEFPLYSIVINLFLLPLSSILIGLAFLVGIIGILDIGVTSFLTGGVHYLLALIKILCKFFEQLPGCTQIWGKPSLTLIFVYYIGIIVGISIVIYFLKLRGKMFEIYEELNEEEMLLAINTNSKGAEAKMFEGIQIKNKSIAIPNIDEFPKEIRKYLPKKKKFATILIKMCLEPLNYHLILSAMLILCILFLPRRSKGLQITMLDVGQGDCNYIETENGRNYIIDGGSSQIKQVGKYRILPFLKSKGRQRVDAIFISHSDEDHINGIIELIEAEFEIGQVILPELVNKSEAYLQLEDVIRQARIPIRYIQKGDKIIEQEFVIQCLHPEPKFSYSSENAYSTVLKVLYEDTTILFTGDVENEGEEALCESIKQEPCKVDILKVAHHGSKNSNTEELIARIEPNLSLISCGKKNRYGHPHEELLSRLQERNTTILRTDQVGAITIKCYDHKIYVELFKKTKRASS